MTIKLWGLDVSTPSTNQLTDSWCAESALGAISLRDSFLRWMWAFDIANAFNGYDMLPIHADQRRQTCIDTGMVYLLSRWVELRDHNRASSTSSLSTSQLCSCQTYATKVFEEGDFWVDIVQDNACAIEVESERIVVGSGD